MKTPAVRLMFDYADLHPVMKKPVDNLARTLNSRDYRHLRLDIFEGYRTPERQAELFAKGATKARPWYSAHQWGMAVDFAQLLEDGNWHWPPADWQGWKDLQQAAHEVGLLRPISWDYGHIQSPYWRVIR